MKHDPIHHARPARAFVLFRSGRRLDLLNPRSDGWTEEDLAHNLARISRWGGATRWRQSLSVAQHSLLGEPFRQLKHRLQALVGERYALPSWEAAASEAHHVVGWSREDMRDALGILCERRWCTNRHRAAWVGRWSRMMDRPPAPGTMICRCRTSITSPAVTRSRKPGTGWRTGGSTRSRCATAAA